MENSADQIPHSTPLTQLKNVSLKAAGYAYLVGDAALFAAGLMEKNTKGAITGALWGVGGLAAARYGNPTAEKQIELVSTRLGEYLAKQGIKIPSHPTTALLAKENGLLDHVEQFLYHYPSEMLNAIYMLGATQMVSSGISRKFTPDIVSGILIGAGALAGILIHEKKPDSEHPPHGALEKAVSWIQEKPLRLPGATARSCAVSRRST